jgi:hypothetical protein
LEHFNRITARIINWELLTTVAVDSVSEAPHGLQFLDSGFRVFDLEQHL